MPDDESHADVPVLFVDIDGVFHDFGGLPFSHAPALIALLAGRKVRLVVHSSWRLHFPFDELKAWFPAALRPYLHAATVGIGRYQSVLRYLDEHRVRRFLVLDDALDGVPASWIEQRHFVLCDPATGVAAPAVIEAIKHFLDS